MNSYGHIYTCHYFQNISFSLECFRKMLRILSWLICFPNMEISRIYKFWEVHNKQAKVMPCGEVALLINRVISITWFRHFVISTVYFQLTLLFFSLPAGCAFLKYETKEQALAAIEALNGKHKIEVWKNELGHESNCYTYFISLWCTVEHSI